MQYRFSALGWKLLALLLVVLSLTFGFLAGYTTAWCLADGYYDEGIVYQTTDNCYFLAQEQAQIVAARFLYDPDYNRWNIMLENSSFRFILLEEETGKVVASYIEGMDIDLTKGFAENPYLYREDYPMSLGETGSAFEGLYVTDYYPNNAGLSETPLQMLCLLPGVIADNPKDVFSQGQRQFNFLYGYRITAPVLLGLSAVLLAVAVCFLLCQSGRRPGREGITLRWIDHVPLDLILVAAVGVMLIISTLVSEILYVIFYNRRYGTNFETAFSLAGTTAIFVCGALLLLAFFCTTATRIKAGGFWRNFLLVRLLLWGLQMLRRGLLCLGRWLLDAFRAIGLAPRAALAVLGVIMIEIILLTVFMNSYDPFFPALFLLIFNLGLFFLAIKGVKQLMALKEAGSKLAAGDLSYQLDTSKLFWDFQRHGENLNAIAEGMNKAVEQRMKSERLKTELITNVSHDIKTPLTSIVNYVDLLQKPHSEAEGAQYLEVLDRQAKRLKKLTEDLVEASKASTGNMAVVLAPTSVSELLSQAVEEYRGRLEQGKLEVVLSVRPELTVLADGRLLWRVLDNLLGNVVKYALPGTRVYVTAVERGQQAAIAVKNISREALNIDADELMERFVRGDAARHSEGSGLGLNIARSLTQLQKGQFQLTVDGDLFKAEVVLPQVARTLQPEVTTAP